MAAGSVLLQALDRQSQRILHCELKLRLLWPVVQLDCIFFGYLVTGIRQLVLPVRYVNRACTEHMLDTEAVS